MISVQISILKYCVVVAVRRVTSRNIDNTYILLRDETHTCSVHVTGDFVLIECNDNNTRLPFTFNASLLQSPECTVKRISNNRRIAVQSFQNQRYPLSPFTGI